jgi:CBS domain-containing membrane protein
MLKHKPVTVADLMTRKIIAIGENDTLENLEENMERFRFRHLPVVDGDKLIGLVTHRDLLHASSSFLSDRESERNKLIHKVPVGTIMQTEVLTVESTDKLLDVAKLMWESKLGCLPVVDGGKLVGIVTEADFIRLAGWFLEQEEKEGD